MLNALKLDSPQFEGAGPLPEDPEQLDALITIGRVRRAVGLDGRVEVELFSGDLSRLATGAVFIVDSRELTVEKASPSRKGLISVRFEGVKDRDSADMLRGAELEMPESALPPAPEGVFYHYQIIGSSVVDLEGRQIGSVSGIMETGANDVYVVSKPDGGDILVPATRNAVKEVDTVSKVITVDLPPELTGSRGRPDQASQEDQDQAPEKRSLESGSGDQI